MIEVLLPAKQPSVWYQEHQLWVCVIIGMTGFRCEHMSATSLFRLLSLLVVQQLVSEDASICLVCHCVCALFTADVRNNYAVGHHWTVHWRHRYVY